MESRKIRKGLSVTSEHSRWPSPEPALSGAEGSRKNGETWGTRRFRVTDEVDYFRMADGREV
jgi:hypothetical protein